MNADDILMDIEFERGFDMDDDYMMNYRERNGSYSLGRVEDDPQMDQFDEMMDLARSLRR
ncbi:hypothetical protein K2Y11_06495 [bacterium]|jgi:hypothetical protein|nr:hypothetical protein [bacterium]